MERQLAVNQSRRVIVAVKIVLCWQEEAIAKGDLARLFEFQHRKHARFGIIGITDYDHLAPENQHFIIPGVFFRRAVDVLAIDMAQPRLTIGQQINTEQAAILHDDQILTDLFDNITFINPGFLRVGNRWICIVDL